MKKLESNLDERQEQTLLKIEHNGCWFAFWGLLVAIFTEQFIFGFEWRILAGEWIVFIVLALYLAFACLRNGIWDRRLKPTGKTNFVVSLIAGVVAAALTAAILLVRYPDAYKTAFIAGGITFAFVFVLCFVILQIMAGSYRRKVEKMEQEPEEEI